MVATNAVVGVCAIHMIELCTTNGLAGVCAIQHEATNGMSGMTGVSAIQLDTTNGMAWVYYSMPYKWVPQMGLLGSVPYN